MNVGKRGQIVLVLALLLLLIVVSLRAETTGCYTYSAASEELYCSQTTDTVAREDCQRRSGCQFNQVFTPNSDCSDIDECQQITCSVDCLTQAKGKCLQRGGQEVSEEQYGFYCNPGCCKIRDRFCQYNLIEYQCKNRAQQLGFSTYDIFANVNMDAQKCAQDICGRTLEHGTFEGYTNEPENRKLADVTVEFEGRVPAVSRRSDAEGHFLFDASAQLNPGTYLVKASQEGYVTATATIVITANQVTRHNFTLVPTSGLPTVSGIVQSGTTLLAGATVVWSGSVSGQAQSNDNGAYTSSGLPPGQYTFTVSKVGYQPQRKSVTITTTAIIDFNFDLPAGPVQGVQGKTQIDDAGRVQPVYNVNIYIDDVFRGKSLYPDGSFEIAVDVQATPGTEEHKLTASYGEFSIERTFQIGRNQNLDLGTLTLAKREGECHAGNVKNVELFSASPVPGKKAVSLQWERPCPEVQGYILTRTRGEETKNWLLTKTQASFADTDVEWTQTYQYSLVATYGGSLQSPTPATQPITVGNPFCEGHYNSVTQSWDRFCLTTDRDARKRVWSCDNQNRLVHREDCTEQDITGEDYYCAPVSKTEATCKSAGPCGREVQQADPFGLYYSRASCYGTSRPGEEGTSNYCYFEYTPTVVDQCKSCTNINSCFDYQSEDACTTNNCLSESTGGDTGKERCAWVNASSNAEVINYGFIIPDFVSSETGRGYCVESDYNADDRCSLCSSGATLFENYFCTAEVCSGLGRCFSHENVGKCNPCGESPTTTSNCYQYATELECTAGQSTQRDGYGQLTFSKDRCGWERCAWQGIPDGPGTCIKDGDGNSEDDCTVFSNRADIAKCHQDNTAPRTKLIPDGIPSLSLSNTNVTFEGDDLYHTVPTQRSNLASLSYCLRSTDAQDQSICSIDLYHTVPYPGHDEKEPVSIDIVTNLGELTLATGKAYRVLFFSQDKYANQENPQQGMVFIDNVAPDFTIKETHTTEADLTDLAVYLDEPNEPMQCAFSLKQILPLGETQLRAITRDSLRKEAAFENLGGIRYLLNVTCEDDHQNARSKTKNYVFDQEQGITIISPQLREVLASQVVRFKVSTQVGATCSLHTTDTNEKIVDFVTNEEGKIHETPLVPGFVEREYAAEHKVVCTELLTGESTEDYFHFRIDFTSPETQIILQESAREERPTTYGWEKFFVRRAQVSFTCTAEGFPCSSTKYCLGPGCELISNPRYTEYTQPFEVTNTTPICYYSLDEANNVVYQPMCGKITIEGIGITLQRPPLHYYRGEQWGVSNTPLFDWFFFTKVPTTRCKFDFVSGFDYAAVPPFKTVAGEQNQYRVANFPDSVFSDYDPDGEAKALYVACELGELGISPEQRMYLVYDPTAPLITDASADPDPVLEGISTRLTVDTDDPTLCRFSDDSVGQGSREYDSMEYGFPGVDEKALELSHANLFYINFVGARKEYALAVQCRNGAGDQSGVKDLSFVVDYAAAGNIASIFPDGGYFPARDVRVHVETTKNARCEFKMNDTFVPLDGAGGKVHTATLHSLPDGYYQYPVRCRMGDRVAEAKITFTIDLTPPMITDINDGNYSCGSNESMLMVYTDEANITGYYVEVYDFGEDPKAKYVPAPVMGNATGNASRVNRSLFSAVSTPFAMTTTPNASRNRGALAWNHTFGAALPLLVPNTFLQEGHRYTVKVSAGDGAGNWGSLRESDGFFIVHPNHSTCINDIEPPTVTLLANESCTATLVEAQCTDATGCKRFQYGQHSTSASCQFNSTYMLGQKVSYARDGWFCYWVMDNVGNNASGSKPVLFTDDDGDKISNSCDRCSKTAPGRIVDAQGCSGEQTPDNETRVVKDADGDGLPDNWENSYNALGCELDPHSPDSDGDGTSDTDEDYDLDGRSNYEEYTQLTHPCVVDEAPLSTELRRELGLENGTTERLPEPPLIPPIPEGADIVAWIFLILGLLLCASGTGYLIYYYKHYQQMLSSTPAKAGPKAALLLAGKPTAGSRLVETFKALRRGEMKRAKARLREAAFGAFDQSSASIPHIEPVLSKRAPHLSRVQELAQTYTEHKEEIKPGLRQEEKSVFAQLESIAKQSTQKNIKEVVSAGEAKDLFSKLKELSKKRKESS